jgi:hypothetical protein
VLLDFAREHEASARVLFCESLAGGVCAMDRRDALIDEIAGLVESRRQSQAKDAAMPDGTAYQYVTATLDLALTDRENLHVSDIDGQLLTTARLATPRR